MVLMANDCLYLLIKFSHPESGQAERNLRRKQKIAGTP